MRRAPCVEVLKTKQRDGNPTSISAGISRFYTIVVVLIVVGVDDAPQLAYVPMQLSDGIAPPSPAKPVPTASALDF